MAAKRKAAKRAKTAKAPKQEKVKMVKVSDSNAPGGFRMVNEGSVSGDDVVVGSKPSKAVVTQRKEIAKKVDAKPKTESVARKGGDPANN